MEESKPCAETTTKSVTETTTPATETTIPANETSKSGGKEISE